MKKLKKIDAKFVLSMISFLLIIIAPMWILKMDEISNLPPLYRLIACLTIPLFLTVIGVSYLTGQAKIDVEASAFFGRDNDEEKTNETPRYSQNQNLTSD